MRRLAREQRARLATTVAAAILLAGCDPGPVAAADVPGVRLSILALGDTGEEPALVGRSLQQQMRVARALEAEHVRRPADALVLLGDNFYPDGLQERELEERVRENLVRPYCAFLALDGPESARVADACEPSRRGDRPTPLFAVLGNHDTKLPESVRLQREVVPRFVPNWRLPAKAVEVVELLDDSLAPSASLVLYDAAALADSDDVESLRRALVGARGPWRILAGHYPINQNHPGPWIRKALDQIAVPVHLHLAGHEHNLQIAAAPPSDPYLQVVAGSGSDLRRVKHPLDGSRFAAIEPGFARVDLAGEGDAARLVVSLVAVARSPFALREPPRVVARWSVGLRGDVREEPIAVR
ncbi:MAG: hypothetical protein DCC71_03295 [Proteobacteria bacterium]|nr:MAG: hypothetical protein DCC71_03295 [Pseudomonadota bacterium]